MLNQKKNNKFRDWLGFSIGLFVLLHGGGLFAAGDENSDLITLVDFQRLYIDDRPTPPVDVEEGWETATLKDIWTLRRRMSHLEGWYRVDFELDSVPQDRWGIYIARVSSKASIWLNTVEIGNAGDFSDPTSNVWNHPQLFELPAEFLKEGSNTLYIRLKVIESEAGMLFEPIIGPYAELEQIYQTAFFFKVTASKILSVAMVLMVLITIYFYFFIRLPSSYLWFLAGTVLWTIYSFDLFITSFPVAHAWWDWLSSFSIYAAAVCYFAAVSRMLDRSETYRVRFFEKLLIALGAIHPVLKLTLPTLGFSFVAFLYSAITVLIITAISIRLVYRGFTSRREGGMWMLVSGAIILILIAYDTYMYTFRITALFAKYPYIPLVSTLCGVAIFFTRIITIIRENENFKINFQAVDSAISSERERLLREIHDGVGGQLVSTLAIMEKGNFRQEDIMDSVKTSLDDLRLILSSLEPLSNQGDVLGILATVRERLEYRLLQAGIQLRWRVQDIPEVKNFDSEKALHLMRILQEAITNVVKHANASEITISCSRENKGNRDGVCVHISDNGHGVEIDGGDAPRSSGFGIKNMQNRAEFLHGELSFVAGSQGSRVELWIPLDPSLNP